MATEIIRARNTKAIDMSGYEDALAAFIERYPGYSATREIDRLRAAEYPRLDETGHVYLDYTGGGLYARSQVEEHLALLQRHVFGNPHSNHPASVLATQLIEETRASVLRHFHASPDEYAVVFTLNATGALKLVAEA